MDNVIHIDPLYFHFRKMWNEDRWQFAGELARLTIKQTQQALGEEERSTMDVLDRIIKEKKGHWTEGYDWLSQGIVKSIRLQNFNETPLHIEG